MSLRDRVERQAEELRATRDEIKLQLHLGKMDARDQWDQIEKQWEHAEGKLKQLAEAANETTEDIAEATQMVLSEMKDGYKKLRSLL